MDTRVVIITGASSGIGAAVARRLAKDGWRMTLAARRKDRLEQLAQEVGKLGGEALVVPADVSQLADIERIQDTCLERWGKVDVLFNNAGVSQVHELSPASPEAIHAEITVNLEAVIQGSRLVLPIMLRQKSGHIINTSSQAGLVALPGNSIYSATKYGVVGFSDALRREVRGSGVHVSAFCPGFTPSEINPGLKKHYEGSLDAPRVPGLMPNSYVAEQVRWLIDHPRRIFVIPKTWRVLMLLATFFPGLADVLVTKFRSGE